MPLALIALALGGFGIGLTEFVIMGLLPEVAADFAVDEAVAGYLISGYALAVAVGGIALPAALARWDRRTVLASLMVLFVVGNLLSALAPTYGVLLAGRVVAALCHGAFFGVGAVVAAGLVAPDRRAAAISLMFGGLTLANVLGVPLGTFLGQQLGWRSTFWAITVIGLVALVGLRALLPSVPATGAGLGAEFGVFARPQVWVSIVVTILGFGGMFGGFTYMAFILTEVSGFASSTVPWLLVLFGVGLFAGNVIGGRAADRALAPTLITLFAVLVVVLAGFALTAAVPAAAIVGLLLMGAFGFGTVPGLQLRIMTDAGDAPTVASGANIAAFNLGNALGAWLGGLTISAGLGFTSPLWAGAGLSAAGLAVLVVATLRRRRHVVASAGNPTEAVNSSAS